MLNIVEDCTKEQEEKILKKYLNKVYHCKYSYDGEDSVGFMWCSGSIFGKNHGRCLTSDLSILQWQVRRNTPMFFSLQKGGFSYRISYPDGEFLKRLKEITSKTIEDFNKGGKL
jgi:hypothetical protein